MKNSELFHLAQQMVIDSNFPQMSRLAVLKLLIEEENTALILERAKKADANEEK